MRNETQMYQLLLKIAEEDDRILAVQGQTRMSQRIFFKTMILFMWCQRQVLLSEMKIGRTNLERFFICSFQTKVQIIQMTRKIIMVG